VIKARSFFVGALDDWRKLNPEPLCNLENSLGIYLHLGGYLVDAKIYARQRHKLSVALHRPVHHDFFAFSPISTIPAIYFVLEAATGTSAVISNFAGE
jgi:hypothetical protein